LAFLLDHHPNFKGLGDQVHTIFSSPRHNIQVRQ